MPKPKHNPWAKYLAPPPVKFKGLKPMVLRTVMIPLTPEELEKQDAENPLPQMHFHADVASISAAGLEEARLPVLTHRIAHAVGHRNERFAGCTWYLQAEWPQATVTGFAFVDDFGDLVWSTM